MTRGRRTAVLIGSLFILVATVVQFAQLTEAPVAIQLIAFNDFHGGLEPASGGTGRIASQDAGGIEYLAAHINRLKADNPNTFVVAAGDNFGGTPLLSSLFHDEPTVEALNLAGLQISALGNHELDEGWWEFYRMQKGGCHPTDGCQDGTPYGGAGFTYLAANVTLDPAKADPKRLALAGFEGTRPRPLLPAFTIRNAGGVRIGFIGLILEEAAASILASSTQGLIFEPEIDSVNRAAAELTAMGVNAIVVLMHEGGDQEGSDLNGCTGISPELSELVTAFSDAIDVVVSGHSHQAYNCTIGGKIVTSAASTGRVITDIDLEVRRSDGEVIDKQARNIIVTRDLEKDARQSALLTMYAPAAEKISNRVVGSITASLTREATPAGESVLGDIVADALMYNAGRTPDANPDFAMWNSGGIRADLAAPAGRTTPVTFAQIFAVAPFGNELIVKSITGDILMQMLEEQFGGSGGTGDRVRIMQMSDQVRYAYDATRPFGQRIDRASLRINDEPWSADRTYRLATSNFLWDAGDGLGALKNGSDPVLVGVDHELIAQFFLDHSPISPTERNRIRKIR